MFAFVEAQPELSFQENILKHLMYSFSITISHFCFESSKVFRDLSVDLHLCR